jgi:outer membrane protein OmpA-like peptidoglycan-associated protein
LTHGLKAVANINDTFYMKKTYNKLIVVKGIAILFICLLFAYCNISLAQQKEKCGKEPKKKALKLYNEAIVEFKYRKLLNAVNLLKEATSIDDEYVDAYYVLGLIYIEQNFTNVDLAEKYFLKVIELCPEYDIYPYYYLGDIYYGRDQYDKAATYLSEFVKDVDKIKSDADYFRANGLLEYAKFYQDMIKNPVPFEPFYVTGISTKSDEYLPIISPDNKIAMFTRKSEIPVSKGNVGGQKKYQEKFCYSVRNDSGSFDEGQEMPEPFNTFPNEGGATVTVDNKHLYYTVCQVDPKTKYYNCDIYSSDLVNGTWTEIKNLGTKINSPTNWDSQPTVTADGNTLYFISDRAGGYGGYDIYKIIKNDTGGWSAPINLGPTINTKGNEKSPFIHSDSQTLYYASDGLLGMGGYDIFFSKLGDDGKWGKPKNIGYPINTVADDVGLFVSTDGRYAYFCSNKLNGPGGWDLYSFSLYDKARPERVLFITGDIKKEGTDEFLDANIELKNIKTKKITHIPVDTITGKYIAIVLFKDDYILTVKKEGYVKDTKYISQQDSLFDEPAEINFNVKELKVGQTYKINDIYFATNSFDLTEASKSVLNEFIDFLNENERVNISIHGHTDNVGNDEDNLVLSENRSKSVYEYMVQNGIDPNRLSYKGFGEIKPVANNETSAGRAKNRRTEFVIVSK